VKYPKGFCCSPQLNNGQDAFNPTTQLRLASGVFSSGAIDMPGDS
jgi:hypothetical protein